MGSTTIFMMLTTILSSIPGDGDTDGHGDLGAAGMADSGDGITLITGATGDGDQVGDTTDTGVDMLGTTDVILIEVEEAVSVTVSITASPSEPATWLTEEIPACQEAPSADGPMVSRPEACRALARSEVATG